MRFFLAAALISFASADASAVELTWREKAQRDLAAMRVAIEDSHPGAADIENPSFRSWLYDGYFKALAQVAKVTDYGGYAAVLRYYAIGFHDIHLRVTPVGGPSPRTPGFLTKLKHGEFVVAARLSLEAHTPPIGSTLVSCDGKSAMMLAHDNLDPYFTVSQLNAHRSDSAPRLFFDDHNPFITMPRECAFRLPGDAGETRNYVLQWVETSSGNLEAAINGINGWTPNMGVRKVGRDTWWVTLPSMNANPDQPQFVDFIFDIRDKAEQIRKGETLVIDVRANGGGRPEWGTAIANEIWGDAYVRSHAPDATLDTRVSATTYAFMTKPAGRKALEGYAELEHGNATLADAMADAWAHKRPWVSMPVYPGSNERGRKVANPVRANVVLLTDTRCVSACLVFADLLFDLADVVHVGLPTNADTQYTAVRPQKLESDNAEFELPTAVLRRRKRAVNQTYVPKHYWRGEIGDTYAIERWVPELPELQKHPQVAAGDEPRRSSRPARGRKR